MLAHPRKIKDEQPGAGERKSSAMSGPLAKEIEVNGVRLPDVEQGSGESIVFVHGVFSDLRIWEPVRE